MEKKPKEVISSNTEEKLKENTGKDLSVAILDGTSEQKKELIRQMILGLERRGHDTGR